MKPQRPQRKIKINRINKLLFSFLLCVLIDGLVKSLKTVTPAKAGVQNYLN